MIFFEICKFPIFLIDRHVVDAVNFVIVLRKWVFGVERGIMKAKIDKDGLLSIERKGEWRLQPCPHAMLPYECDDRICGDWCPLFEECDCGVDGWLVHLRCALDGVVHQVVSDERAG